MKDEIKRILEFKENADYKRLSIDGILVIKDYITNLQEENKRLKNYINSLGESKLIEKTINEKEHYKKSFIYVSKDALDYKSRIDKAIEMFKKAFDYRDSISANNWEYDGGSEEYMEMLESVYNILQGSDK